MRIVFSSVIQDKLACRSAGCSAVTFLFSAWLLVFQPTLGAGSLSLSAPNDQENPAVASNGDGYLVVWADKRNDRSTYDIYGARVSATGQVLDPEGIPICTAPDSQWYPAVASDGTNYLVVWSDSRHNGADGYSLELYGARISPGGAVLDSGAFKMTQGEVVFQPTVAFNGTEYLVAAYAWEHNGHRGTTLLGVRVTPTGVVRDSQELILHQSGAGSGYPAIVASLGEDWLVAWNLGGNGVAGARVSRNGVVSSPQMFVNRGETWIHGLAAAGNSYFLTSVASRQIGTDTHVMDVFGTRITPEGQPQSTVLIAANTNQTIGSHLQPTTYMQYQPTAAANGSDVFVVWEAGAIYTNGGNFRFLSDIRGARVNASGEVSPVVSICAAPQDQGYSALAFNGQQFLAVWQDARTAPPEDYTAYNHFDVYGARLTPGGAVIESDGFLISKLKSNRIICPPPIQWQHSFGGSDYDYLYSLEPTTDGGYILGGLSYSPTNGNKTSPHVGGSFNADVWLIRLNASGQKVWERAFGGNENENALSVKQTADGGFIVAGWSASGPSGNKTSPHLGWEDGWVIRLDAQGNKLWERTFGGGLWEFFFQVHELPDGGFILGGLSGSCPGCAVENGEGDYWVVRIDGQGNKLWERFYGGPGREQLLDLRSTSDGGFILGGYSSSSPGVNKTSPNFGGYDFWVVRLDANGNRLWDRSFGGAQDEEVRSLHQTSDSGFLLAGRSYSGVSGNKTSPSHGSSDYWLVRITPDGTKLWDKAFGGSRNDELYTLHPLPGGGWLLGGESGSPPDGTKTSPYHGGSFPGGDYWVVRLDTDANPVWDQSLGGAQDDFMRVVRPATDGGIVLAGYAESSATGNKTTASFGRYDWWIVKLAPPSPDDCDTDRDGVPNDRDECPDTSPGAVVNEQGCSIPQLCPCDGPWRNHGEYVRCVTEHAWQFFRDDLITADERRDYVRDAARSDCGRQRGARLHLQPQTPAEIRQHGREFIATGDLTGGCVLESSADLIHWTAVATNRTAGVECRIADPYGHGTPTRFYRLRLLPR